ncbi:putative O-glycosylation ligase, exosortase A system-associated [Alteraurantiacibacter aquimixticola]|uniref:Putative O-glycosylation ligase, exosortase A system-associated n=1 Tax=Alteraurantiacibacter aquimixticola TaxID=2489173 RepID=A0A4T3EWX0_9SPHN|nr:putative O-glycosylation ligase, exosortase A system-associated [Alteraurantiacibacter aquimixticola]TIX48948.1 putative O-glycosylation ligase, exosortase A system-associated [Alteraurantiacibacter aquimixticola]
MLDLFLLGFIGLLLACGLKRPFIWVLAYIYIDIVAPQKIGWSIIQAIPVSLIAFLAAFAGWVLLDGKKGSRFTFRQGLMLALLLYCGMTTLTAAFPDSAWDKWDWVWKALLFAIFLPLTLRTKLRLEAAVLFIVLAVGTIAINGGIKTIFGGGGYGTLSLLVDENAGLYEGSIISTVAICIIPLALWLARHGTIFKPDWKVWGFTAGLIFACLLIPVGTGARTGLVCIAVLGVLLLRSVRYRFVYAGAAALAMMAAIPFLPQSYLERMGTIAGYESDQSASTRLAVWEWTIGYAKANPLGGGFDAYRANSFTYQTRTVSGEGASRQVTYNTVTEEGRAYHSSYFELLGEQGWIGLGLWLWLQALGLWHMERLRWRLGKLEGGKRSWQWGLATALQQAHIVFLVGALFVGIAYQPFLFMLVGLQCGLWSYVRRTEEPASRAKFKPCEPKPEAPAPAA